MFAELQPLLDGRSFTLIINPAPEGQIRLNFIPTAHSKDTEQDKPLLQPLTITGAPDELDEGLAGAITEYREAYLSMSESVAATKKQMADAKAKEELDRKAKADALKNKTKTVAPAAKPATPATAAAPSLFDAPAAPAAEEKDEEEVWEG